jgi:hypothetical protein
MADSHCQDTWHIMAPVLQLDHILIDADLAFQLRIAG